VFVAVYAAHAVLGALRPGIATEVLRMVSMDTQQSVTGLIVRYEEVFFAPRDGRVEFLVHEAERVRQGAAVASIQDAEAMGLITQAVGSVEDEIMMLHERRHWSEADATVQRINATLGNVMSNNMHHFSALNLAEIHALHDRLAQLTTNRNQIIINDSRGAVGEIGRQHEQLLTQIGINSMNMYAGKSGIMFPIVDGYEREFTPANMTELTLAQLRTTVDHTALLPARDVSQGTPVFKLVGNIWYIVARIPNEMTAGFAEGVDRVIFARNESTGVYEPLPVRIMYMDTFAWETLVVFRSSRNVIDFLSQRNISIRIIESISQGLQVPRSAIVSESFVRIPITHVHDQYDYYAHHLMGGYIARVPLEIVNRTDSHVYVLSQYFELSRGDLLAPVVPDVGHYMITESSTVVVNGVYRATLGYARFTSIYFDNDISDVDGYVLLDPARNRNLVQFDVIVSDATTVNHLDIINR